MSQFGQQARRLSAHLGLNFGRFIDHGLSIYLDLCDETTGEAGLARLVEGLNPFPTKSGDPGYPATFRAVLPSSETLDLVAHIWPANSATDRGYRLDGRAAQAQGFYFYRNDRLIQAGGWNHWRQNSAEPHLSLARVCIDLPVAAESSFSLNAQKNGIAEPAYFGDAIDGARAGSTTMADYVRRAQEVYRSAGAPTDREMVVPGRGLRAELSRHLGDLLTGSGPARGHSVPIRWGLVDEEGEDRVFAYDFSHGVLTLNERYRAEVLNGTRGSAADAPLVKTLLFLLLREDLHRAKATPKIRDRHAEINRCLVAALTYG